MGGHGGPGLEGGGSVGRGGEYLGFGGGREGSHWSRSAPEEVVGYSHWSRLKARTESGGTVTGGADWSSSAPECTGAE